MKKDNREIIYETKGKVSSFQDGILNTMVIGKNTTKTDSINLNEMMDDIEKLIKSVGQNDIEFKLSVKKTDKEDAKTDEEIEE